MLIINADDFGLNHPINMAILQAFDQGLCSSATIMANMPGFEEACELVHERELNDHIGIHLVLTEGYSLTEKIRRCPRFCNAEGVFCLSRKERLFRLSKDEREALAEEVFAQMERCRRNHLRLTHLDSHNHAHEEWGIASTVIPIVRATRIPYVRLSRNYGPGLSPMKRLYKQAFNLRLRRNGLARTRYFGAPDDCHAFFCDPQHGENSSWSWEVMTHPAFDEDDQLVDSWIQKPLQQAIQTIPVYENAISYGGRSVPRVVYH